MILVIDVGTTGLRAAVVGPDAAISAVNYRPFPPTTPYPGLVEFDAAALAALVLDTAAATLSAAGRPPIDAVGVAAQRASTVIWERATGVPLAPALGWQDLRTVGECITAKAEHGLPLAPNQSATKITWLLQNVARDRSSGDVCVGTIDSWIAWTLTRGAVHVTDHTNAAVTGLYSIEHRDWDSAACAALGIPIGILPTIVDTSGVIGEATALTGAPALAALVGDQQGSLVGQGCVAPGRAKITFGTGGMLDMCTGAIPPAAANRLPFGSFPIVAWTAAGDETMWGVEGIMLSAGTNIEWLRDDLGLIATSADSDAVARGCATTDGVVYVPALLGLGTPHWDYGARGTLLGLTRGSERSHVVRAVLEGIAHRGADLVEAAESDTGQKIGALRIDGGMSRNPTFVQALANATQRTIEVAPTTDATTVGAGLLAGAAVGTWPSVAATASTWQAADVIEPDGVLDRSTWMAAVERSRSWIPELSALDF